MPKNSFYINTLDLPCFDDMYQFSRITSLSTRVLYCLSKKNYKYYKVFTISKKSGGHRIISAPSYSMKMLQKWILHSILNKIVPSKKAMAFRKGCNYGCKINAKHHLGSLYGLSIDLKDFFPSITSNKVYCLFKNIGYNNFAATILTNICTINNALPQGGVCSPALSNLVGITLDNRLTGICEKRGIKYTRYADDMYFSCDNKGHLKKLFPIFKSIIEDEGFEINNDKVHYYSPARRTTITGITIAKVPGMDTFELKAKKQLKREVRAKIHKAIVTGDYSEKDKIKGIISYIDYIEREIRDYKEEMKEYIQNCVDKVKYFRELVKEYNENLFYNDLPMISAINSNFLDDAYMELYDIISDRTSYLQKRGLPDICDYNDFPEFTIEDLNDSDILPF